MDIIENLIKLKNPEKSKILQKFFKTGIGEYGEGDIFLGIKSPDLRKIAKENLDLEFGKIQKLISSKYHESRLLAVMILVYKYEKTKKLKYKKDIFNFYLKNIKYINNWDIVDISCYKIVGNYIYNFEPEKVKILYKFSNSKNLWERRISIVSLFYFIKNNNFSDTLKICKILINDKEDLINKACGWMLREIGKRDIKILYDFLDKYANIMPRVELRYSIEKLEKQNRLKYLNKKC
ncbi:DNA alkylation repair protein [Patescibacteria group bacterium]|nr:DNA alkylation repair protein [Patescibacteria group bacterium]